MKKLIASASLVTLGAAGLQAAYAPGLTPMETSKPGSITAAVRGFYDDNYNNAPDHASNPTDPVKKSSGGFEISPSAKLNLYLQQTLIQVGYNYSLKYYFDRPKNPDDHLHELTLKVDHQMSERYKALFEDSFVYTVEPEITSSGAVTTFNRQNADSVHNRAKLTFTGQLTELLGAQASYQNSWYRYLENTTLEANLDRLEHLFDIRGTMQMQEHLTGFLGYQYGIVSYTADLPLNDTPGNLPADTRDNTSHYFYIGAEHAFSSQFNGSVQVGGQYTLYDNLHDSSFGPYADLRSTYTYLPGSSIQAGLTHTRNATDQAGVAINPDQVTKDQESTTLFASVNHRITPRITGHVLGQYQHSTFSGGAEDGEVDNFILLGLNLEYRINNNWLTEIGYNLDHLSSDLPDRSFTRNRIYAGVRATF